MKARIQDFIRAPIRGAAFAAALGAPVAAVAAADERGDGTWSISASVFGQSDADLDDGGEVGRTGAMVSAGVHRQLDPGLGLGANFSEQYTHWTFDDPSAFGGVAPWKNVHRATLGLQVRKRLNDTWSLFAAPMLQYSAESGASFSDALRYGGAIGVVRDYGPDLKVGFGATVVRDIDKTRLMPLVGVWWKIDEHWSLGNSDPAGATGLAGVELAYRRNARWDFGVGVGFDRYRFRLDEHGPAAGGVGESRSASLYGRVSFQPHRVVRLDAYAGASFANELRVESPGRHRVTEKYDTAPVVGFAVSVTP